MSKMELLKQLRKKFKKNGSRGHKMRTTSENSIEDALKAVSLQGNDDSKAHMEILREVLSWYDITPDYQLLRVEGKCHEPIFKFRLWFNDKDAIGYGKTKREAKQSAAKALIDKLTGVCEIDDSTTEDSTSNINDFNSSLIHNAFGNPIGWLQELCTARRWPPPKYENDMAMGRRRFQQFRISCVVDKYREVGQGKTRKIAKQSAAHKVWMMIQKEIYVDSKANQDLEDARLFDISAVNIDNINYIQYLQEVAAAKKIDVQYEHIENDRIAGCFECLVRLSTHPAASCLGIGASKTEAHINAALNAVDYLKCLSIIL